MPLDFTLSLVWTAVSSAQQDTSAVNSQRQCLVALVNIHLPELCKLFQIIFSKI